ncbi:MAG: hypothetical protein CMP49_02700 [Flavobacteriales bacterium]|nr:hypothetical protein [Flavobacteriales bacterium]|tara:strand:- start:32648 stop:33661 length:1014 start_codon:yes stop_codon:yes gene_type:complete
MRYNFFTFLILLFLVFSFLKNQYFQKTILTNDYNFYIHTDDSFHNVKKQLEYILNDLHPIAKLGLNPFLKQKRLDYWFRPGHYILEKSFSINDIINKLRSQSQDPINITFKSTNDISNIIGVITKKLELDSIDVVSYFNSNKLSLDSLYFLLIPNTYQIFWDISEKELVERFYIEYKSFWNEDRLKAASNLNLSMNEVFVLASIIDKEASHFDEMPRIAGLYLNRLKKNWFLAADPTIIYAYEKEYNKSIKRVRNKHINILKESQFNTYHHKGLPPLPICVPSFQALESVLNPESHQYMYMCARPDRSEYHNFSTNYLQHKKNAAAFHRWLNARKIF